MKYLILTLGTLIGGCFSTSMHAQDNLSIAINRLQIGVPVPNMWSGLSAASETAMCAPDNPMGEAQILSLPKPNFQSISKSESHSWAKRIASKADTIKLLMDVVLNHKLSVKVKF